MNLLTDNTQAAYKANHSCADILYLFNKLQKQERSCPNNNNEHQKKKKSNATFTFLDLSKAFDRTNRLKMINVLIEAGLPISLARLISRTHGKTTLNVREGNRIGRTEKTNIGVFQGSPLSALLFVVYTTAMMADYRELKKGNPEIRRPPNRQQPNRQPNPLNGEPANLYIRKKDEKGEHKYTIETFKKKFAEIYLKQKYKLR